MTDSIDDTKRLEFMTIMGMTSEVMSLMKDHIERLMPLSDDPEEQKKIVERYFSVITGTIELTFKTLDMSTATQR